MQKKAESMKQKTDELSKWMEGYKLVDLTAEPSMVRKEAKQKDGSVNSPDNSLISNDPKVLVAGARASRPHIKFFGNPEQGIAAKDLALEDGASAELIVTNSNQLVART